MAMESSQREYMDYENRRLALAHAVEQEPMSHPDSVLKRAQKYYDFLQGSHEPATD